MLNPHFQKLEENYIFPLIEEKIANFKQTYPTTEVLNLGVGDVCLPLSLKIAEAICEGVKEMSQKIRGYGPCNGYSFLRETICEHEYAQYGISADEVFISDGANPDGADIQELFDSDTIVAIPDPSYPMYHNTVLLSGKKLLTIPLNDKEGFIPKPPQEHADLVYLCTPSNPTGIAFSKEQLQGWVDWAKKTGALLIIDNVYNVFVSSGEIPPSIYALDGGKEVAIEIRSFSKSAGFTGLRCGYMVIPKTLFIPELHALWTKRIDIRRNGISYPIQRGAQASYSDAAHAELQTQIDIYQQSAELLRSTLSNLNQTFFGGIHAPYIWWKVPGGKNSWEFFDTLLEKTHIVGIPGSGFGPCGEGYTRLSCFLSPQIAKKASDALYDHLSTN